MKTSLLALSIISILALAGCGNQTIEVDSSHFIKGEEIISFSSIEEMDAIRVSDGYSNGGMFASTWRKGNLRMEDGIGYLGLEDIDGVNYGTEIRSKQGYLYGYFGASMKAFKKQGTVQSLFTYNGGYRRWDEIDIEILGKDTTKVQFNYFEDGVGGHEYLHDLGFDASLEFHDYGFKWEEEAITWYVDYKPVYRVKARLTQWGNFFANVWAGNATALSWLGEYEGASSRLEASYDYLCYAPLQE